MKTCILSIACILFAVGCAAQSPGEGTPGTSTPSAGSPSALVVGRWRSPCVPNGQGQHIALAFDIAATNWNLDYVTYGDDACAAPFLSVRVEGTYALTGASSVAGAQNAVFRFTRKTVTPHGAAAVGYAQSIASCGTGAWSDGVARDVTASGCAGIGQRPVASCGQDYDLVAVDATTLRFGQRPADNDMCTEDKRPAALATLAMQRQP